MTRALILLALLAPACKEDKQPTPAAAEPAATAPAASGSPTEAAPATPAGEQTMTQAMELVCDAPNRVTVPDGASTAERAVATANWIRDNVTNPEALKLMGSLASVMPADRGSMLSDEAKKHGIGTCALAQMK